MATKPKLLQPVKIRLGYQCYVVYKKVKGKDICVSTIWYGRGQQTKDNARAIAKEIKKLYEKITIKWSWEIN